MSDQEGSTNVQLYFLLGLEGSQSAAFRAVPAWKVPPQRGSSSTAKLSHEGGSSKGQPLSRSNHTLYHATMIAVKGQSVKRFDVVPSPTNDLSHPDFNVKLHLIGSKSLALVNTYLTSGEKRGWSDETVNEREWHTSCLYNMEAVSEVEVRKLEDLSGHQINKAYIPDQILGSTDVVLYGCIDSKILKAWKISEFDYEMKEQIGEDAQGCVYKCYLGDYQCAVKKLPVEISSEPCFEVQAMILMSKSRHVVQIFAAWIELHVASFSKSILPRLCIAMQLIPRSISLKDYLKKMSCPEPEATRKIICGIASGLMEIHAAGLMHRDIKPGNILLDQDLLMQ